MQYLTLAREYESELEILKSRFIAAGKEVHALAEAEAYLLQRRERHPTANHHCYAFKLIGPPAVERFSDDGEPTGTAGRPIYTVLEHHITNAVIVVTRYFGGTKLGKGGLVKAYTEAAQLLLHEAGTLTREPQVHYRLSFPYPLNGSVSYWLAQRDLTSTLEYGAAVTAHLSLPLSLREDFEQQANEWVQQGLSYTLLDDA